VAFQNFSLYTNLIIRNEIIQKEHEILSDIKFLVYVPNIYKVYMDELKKVGGMAGE
jgi:hypothetical protein